MWLKFTLNVWKSVWFTAFISTGFSMEALFDKVYLSQYPPEWWNETYLNIGSLNGCSHFCNVLCIGFTWSREETRCLIWKALEKKSFQLATSKENTIPVWLKNGTKSNVDGILTYDKTTYKFDRYIPPDFWSGHSINVTTLHLEKPIIFGQGSNWDILMCDGSSKMCKKWSFGNESWSDSNSLHKRHTGLTDAIGLIGHSTWIIGGEHFNDSLSEQMTPSGRWIEGRKLPFVMYHFGIAPIDKSHVLIAGGSKGQWMNEIRKHNVDLGNWTTVGLYPNKTSFPGCERHQLLNGTAVVMCVGGLIISKSSVKSSVKSCGVYDIGTDSWSLIPKWDLPVACSRPQIHAVGKRLFVLGGHFMDEERDRVLEFKEDKTSVWQEMVIRLPAKNLVIIPYKLLVWSPN
ncbi:uncharacterized protein LOC131883540 [Tigriopus californicus]|uniref:uncharacterized protein LOC131883540 n=1 Tax=Tigriopus californicus TaxID=6832 RepID=UPI0027DA329A|nr:uncharacterized protein LOC131883540 [Tigriopus californicus]